MRRLAVVAILASCVAIPAGAHAACSDMAVAAGVSDTFHAQIENIRLDIRTIGSPMTLGLPPATAVGACTDGSGAGSVRGMHFLITNVTTNEKLCDRWSTDTGSYDPFGFGLVLGAGIHLSKDDARPCGVSATWDPVGYALGVPGYDPTRVRFPAAESDAYGASAGIGIGSVVAGGEIWWTTASGVESVLGTDTVTAYYSRGAGIAYWNG